MAALGAAALPLWQYSRKVQAEAAGEAFLRQLADAQLEFRRGHAAHFATALESLTTPCPGAPGAPLDAGAVRGVGERGFVVLLRPVAGASEGAPDCHGRPTVTDYYVALQPASADAAPRQAYALTGRSGRIFVFFDGLAPLERDMAPGGLATPLDELGTFKIP
jgi:type II secretory pathway pseudopilin PulG